MIKKFFQSIGNFIIAILWILWILLMGLGILEEYKKFWTWIKAR